MNNQYAKRDHEEQGHYYMRHLSAMTGEKLHAKSDIAGELAHRDILIDHLTAERDALQAKLDSGVRVYAYKSPLNDFIYVGTGKHNATIILDKKP